MGDIEAAESLPAECGDARVPGQGSISRTSSKVDRFHTVFLRFESPASRDCSRRFALSFIKSQIGSQDCHRVARGCQPASERPYFDSRAAPIEEGIVGLGHMQEAHRNMNFRPLWRSVSTPAGRLGSRQMLVRRDGRALRAPALGWHKGALSWQEAQRVFPSHELYSHGLSSRGKLTNSLSLGKNIVEDPGQT